MTNDPDHTDTSTLAADEADASAAHDADRPPTADEERRAESTEGADDSASVAENYRHMTETGAHVKGEGAID